MSNVTVRIAPSPTGDPHVGTGYIGLFNYAFAKKNGGKFILRIEDTDQARSTPQSEESILSALRWMGIDWDEGPDKGGPAGPYRQSERLEIYKEHADKLVDAGKAYWCTCTPERLAELRKKQMALKQPMGYDGHCREREPEDVKAEMDGGAKGVVRLRTPKEGKTVVKDRLRGDIVFENTEIDDQVLLKGDGFPTYHLANVVDDKLMGVTHVIRGEEWITSSPKHVLLYAGFGWEPPEFIHLPLLRNADKSKVSKRKNPVSISHYQQAGFLPEAFVNFLGMMAFTLEDGREVFSLEDFVEGFDLERISLGGPVFDQEKLLWLNGKYLRETKSEDDFVAYLQERLFSTEFLKKVVPLVRERVEKAEDFVHYADWLFVGSVEIDPTILMLPEKSKKDSVKFWEGLVEEIDRQYDFTHDKVEALLRDYCTKGEVKPKAFFMPVRLMVTGKKATPPLFETMEVLGRERVRRRMREAINGLKAAKIEPPKKAK